MSDEQRSLDDDLELRESAVDWIEAGAAVVGAAAAVGTAAWTVRHDRRQEAREQIMLDVALARQGYYGGFELEADYDPGFGEPPINLGVEGDGMPIELGVEDDLSDWW